MTDSMRESIHQLVRNVRTRLPPLGIPEDAVVFEWVDMFFDTTLNWTICLDEGVYRRSVKFTSDNVTFPEDGGIIEGGLATGLVGRIDDIVGQIEDILKDECMRVLLLARMRDDDQDEDTFGSLIMPQVRRIFPSLIAKDLVSVQPMTGPVGFALKSMYGVAKAEVS